MVPWGVPSGPDGERGRCGRARGLLLSRSRVLAVLTLHLAFFAPSQPVAGQKMQEVVGGGPPSSVRGKVLEHESGAPLGGATIDLVPGFPLAETPGSRVSEEEGEFLFQTVPPGVYGLRVGRIGNHTSLDTIVVEPDSDIRVVVELSPSPIELDAVIVVVRRSPAMAGFEARRRRGNGTFVTRDEIEDTKPLHVSDLLFLVPGTSFVHSRSGQREIRMREGCRPTVWVNGGKTFDASVSEIGLDQILSPEDVEAIEVYRGAGEVPVQFGPETCGAVVIWTRQSLPEPGEGGALKRMLAAAVLAVGILFLR